MRKALLAFLFLSACSIHNLHPSNPSDLFRLIQPSTVRVETDDGIGSGTVVWSHPSGLFLVLTCAHVVLDDDGNESEGLKAFSPNIGEVPMKVEKLDEGMDLALLSGTQPGYTPPALPLAAREPKLYDKLYVIGSALSRYGSASEGYVSANDVDMPGSDASRYRVTGAFFIFGISGGTAVNEHGELECVPDSVVAADELGLVPATGMGYCISLETIRTFLKGYPVL